MKRLQLPILLLFIILVSIILFIQWNRRADGPVNGRESAEKKSDQTKVKLSENKRDRDPEQEKENQEKAKDLSLSDMTARLEERANQRLGYLYQRDRKNIPSMEEYYTDKENEPETELLWKIEYLLKNEEEAQRLLKLNLLENDVIFREIIAEWISVDPKGAAEWAVDKWENGHDEPPFQPELVFCPLAIVIEEWVKKAPLEATSWASEEDHNVSWKFDRGDHYSLSLAHWIRINPQQAASWIQSGEYPEEDLPFLARQWTKEDPEKAIAWAETIEDPDLRMQYLCHATLAIAKTDIFKAMNLAECITDENNRQKILSIALYLSAEDKPQVAATEALNRKWGKKAIRNHVLGQIAEVWARTDPEKAASLLPEIEAGDKSHKGALLAVAKGWGRKNLLRAMEWAQTLANKNDCQLAMTKIIPEWAEINPQQAAAEARKIEDPLDRSRVMEKVARNWAQEDPEKAASWAMAFSDQEERCFLLTEVARKWAETDPLRAAELAANINSWAFDEVVSIWAAEAAPEAFEWAQKLPDQEKRSLAMGSVLVEWAQKDTPKAANMALEMEYGELRYRMMKKVLVGHIHSQIQNGLPGGNSSGLFELVDKFNKHRKAGLSWETSPLEDYLKKLSGQSR